jgi:hypothetical protein
MINCVHLLSVLVACSLPKSITPLQNRNFWPWYIVFANGVAEGTEVFAHTDHEPLTWLASQKHLNRRQSRWMEFLSRFTYSLLYIQGDKNVVADALSRMLDAPRSPPLELLGDTWPHSTHISDPSNHPMLITEPSTAVLHTATHISAGPKLFHAYVCMVLGIHVAHPIGLRSRNPLFPRNFPATPFPVLRGGHTRARARAGFSGEGSSQKRVEQGRNQRVNPAPRARDHNRNNDSSTMPSERASECARRVPLQGRSSLDYGPNTSQIQARLNDHNMNQRHCCRARHKAWLHTKGCLIIYLLDCEMQL